MYIQIIEIESLTCKIGNKYYYLLLNCQINIIINTHFSILLSTTVWLVQIYDVQYNYDIKDSYFKENFCLN